MGEEFGGQASRTQQRHQGERACARLLGLIAGITADGHLHDLEIQFLRTWLAENTQAFQLMNTGELADKHGEIEVSPRLAKELELVQREMARLGKRIFKN